MNRYANRPAGVLQAALDRLTDPQRPVGRELESTAPIELLYRADQAKHSLLDQVAHGQTQTLVAPCLRHHQAKVRVDHPLLGLEIAALDPLRQLDLLGRRQQGIAPRLGEELLERLADCALLLASAFALRGRCAPALPGVGSGGRPLPGARR